MSIANGKKTVLVIEDNPDDVLLLELAAKELCSDVDFVFVGTGPEALAYLRDKSGAAEPGADGAPALVLLDARLPAMGGLKVLERIRQMPEFAHLMVLLWSDGFEPDLQEMAEKAGADCFMHKPISFKELMQEVKRICDLARAQGPPG